MVNVAEIVSAYRKDTSQYPWINPLMRALEKVPKGLQGASFNRNLAGNLNEVGLPFHKNVLVSTGSEHNVDFLIEYRNDRIAVEIETGQAGRVELDLLKLFSISLFQTITCACLVLPEGIKRHSTMGYQEMKKAVDSLMLMCSPVLEMIKSSLGDLLIIWYL